MNEEKKDLEYWKNNCEEDYITTPISVLRYIGELEKAINKNSVIPDVSNYYYLQDGDDVKNGDEYYDYDTVQDWVTIKDQVGTYKHDSETCYKTRRKI